MNDPMLNRRDLNRLALTALGGLASGVFLGCTPCKPPQNPPANAANADLPLLLHDPHVCRGINTCKDKGKAGTTNDCAGQGHCATVDAHSCQGTNDCKGHGGCDGNPGENDCKNKGACAVPLDAGDKMTWQKARKRFEELMKKTFPDKKVGEAPAA